MRMLKHTHVFQRTFSFRNRTTVIQVKVRKQENELNLVFLRIGTPALLIPLFIKAKLSAEMTYATFDLEIEPRYPVRSRPFHFTNAIPSATLFLDTPNGQENLYHCNKCFEEYFFACRPEKI